MKKNIFILVVTMTLASIFVSCDAGDEENIALSERVGHYAGFYDGKSIETVLVANSDDSGSGTISIRALTEETTPLSEITVTKAKMDSTESSFTNGTGEDQVTITFNSATDKDSDAILKMTIDGNAATILLIKIPVAN